MKEIEEAFKKYLKAIYTRDYNTMFLMLYEPDMQNFREKMVEFAFKMDEFGESQDFIKKLGFQSLLDLKDLPLFDFMSSIFKLISREIGPAELNKILSQTSIINIVETEYYSLVSYEYPVKMFDEWEIYKGEVRMVKVGNDWKIFFKSGLEAGMSRFQEEIDRYFDRKQRDNLSNLGFEGDLTRFSLYGYKDFMSGKVVFEPRFKDAGNFSDGLAYVQIFNKYGFINLKGEIEIKPQYIDARDFSQKLASVQIDSGEEKQLWGFINTKGKLVIPAQFENTCNFSSGLCAVMQDGKWGYINKKGELVIPCRFSSATDFNGGFAFVELEDEEGETTGYRIDKKGRLKIEE